MMKQADQAKEDLVAKVIAMIEDRVPAARRKDAEEFARCFFEGVPPVDLVGETAENLYGAALSIWNFGRKRKGKGAQVRVYTPRQEEHGWQSAHTVVEIINDESSAEAVAKLRAMNEAGNITWDVVDVVAADAIRLCDEGLALEIDPDEQLAPAPDGTSAEDDFGDLLVSDCFIPQIVYSTTFGYRTDMVPAGVEPPSDICSVFDLETY
ncbi:MAG: extracellular solute-binding protein, partial [Limibacillus sp.]